MEAGENLAVVLEARGDGGGGGSEPRRSAVNVVVEVGGDFLGKRGGGLVWLVRKTGRHAFHGKC